MYQPRVLFPSTTVPSHSFPPTSWFWSPEYSSTIFISSTIYAPKRHAVLRRIQVEARGGARPQGECFHASQKLRWTSSIRQFDFIDTREFYDNSFFMRVKQVVCQLLHLLWPCLQSLQIHLGLPRRPQVLPRLHLRYLLRHYHVVK